MAAARSPARSVDRSGPADARIACPQCGGLIHPIAGRCKHCKHDLTASRSSRPAAPVALPPLASNRHQPYVSPAAPAAAPSTVEVAQPHAVVAIAAPRMDSAPILPPRPTGRMPASGTRSTWRSWPMIVIVLAILAIAAAVVLLVWPQDDANAAGAAGSKVIPPPAPDRMDTNPTPTPPPGPRHIPPRIAPPDVDPPPSDPSDPLGQTLKDPFATPTPPPSMMSSTGMISAMIVHACDRIATCPGVDVTVTTVCSAARQGLLGSQPPPTCAAATRCLSRIDALPCDDLVGSDSDLSTSFLMSMATSVQDCMSALRC